MINRFFSVSKKPRFLSAIIIAVASDGLDFIIVGLVPGVSPIIDVTTTYVLYRLIGPLGLFGSPEIIPIPFLEQAVDLLPLHTTGVIIAWFMGVFRKK